jgi:hypothetical protein
MARDSETDRSEPTLVFLDEATSALDESPDTQLYSPARTASWRPTEVSIGGCISTYSYRVSSNSLSRHASNTRVTFSQIRPLARPAKASERKDVHVFIHLRSVWPPVTHQSELWKNPQQTDRNDETKTFPFHKQPALTILNFRLLRIIPCG